MRLFEEVDVELDPKPYRPRRKPEDPIWYIPPDQHRYIHSPTGKLALQITNLAGTGVRGLFRETARRRLEDILPTFVAQLGARRRGAQGKARRGGAATSGAGGAGTPLARGRGAPLGGAPQTRAAHQGGGQLARGTPAARLCEAALHKLDVSG